MSFSARMAREVGGVFWRDIAEGEIVPTKQDSNRQSAPADQLGAIDDLVRFWHELC